MPRRRLARLLEVELARHGATAAPLLAAVSGGIDSTALAVLLANLWQQGRLAVAPALAHIDHGAHPASAAAAAHVRALAQRLDLVCHTRHLALGRQSEATLRAHRYAALTELAQSTAARFVLTAHHRDDADETVLFRFARGSGPRGLTGIPARRRLGDGLAGSAGIELLRPLLPATRADLAAVVAGERLPVTEDPTNADLGFARNRIRRVVLPALRARHGVKFDRALAGVTTAARTVVDHLDRQATRLLALARRPAPWRLELSLGDLTAVPTEIAAAAVQRALGEVHRAAVPWAMVTRTLALLAAPLGRRAGGLGVPLAERTARGLLLVDPRRAGLPPVATLELPPDSLVRFGTTEWHVKAPAGAAGCQVRTRLPGDRFQPAGSRQPTLLRAWFQRQQVPRFDRDRLPVVVVNQQIVAVGGVESRNDAVQQ